MRVRRSLIFLWHLVTALVPTCDSSCSWACFLLLYVYDICVFFCSGGWSLSNKANRRSFESSIGMLQSSGKTMCLSLGVLLQVVELVWPFACLLGICITWTLRLFYLFFLTSWNKHFVLKNICDNVLALYLLYFFSLSDSQSQKSIDSVRIQWTNPSMLSTQRLPYGSIALHPRWGMVMRKLSC